MQHRRTQLPSRYRLTMSSSTDSACLRIVNARRCTIYNNLQSFVAEPSPTPATAQNQASAASADHAALSCCRHQPSRNVRSGNLSLRTHTQGGELSKTLHIFNHCFGGITSRAITCLAQIQPRTRLNHYSVQKHPLHPRHAYRTTPLITGNPAIQMPQQSMALKSWIMEILIRPVERLHW